MRKIDYTPVHVEHYPGNRIYVLGQNVRFTPDEYSEFQAVEGTPEELAVLVKHGVNIDYNLESEQKVKVVEKRGMSPALAATIGFIVGNAFMYVMRLGVWS